jgi:diguanylate cyclase (GGDEF)-like protein/PAS domain S-box-containing protein
MRLTLLVLLVWVLATGVWQAFQSALWGVVLLEAAVLIAIAVFLVDPMVRRIQKQQADQDQLFRKYQQLALVAQRTSSWAAVTDRQRRIIWCNEALLKGLGVSQAEVLGKHPNLLSANRHNLKEDMEALTAQLDQGLGVRVELLRVLPNGHEVWLDVDYQPYHDADGKLEGFSLLATDISLRINTHMRSSTLMAALPVGVLMQDATAQVVECNRAAADLLDTTPDQLIGKKEWVRRGQIVKSNLEPCPIPEQPFHSTLNLGHGICGEVYGLLNRQGQVRWAMVNTDWLRNSEGALMHVVTCLLDVTEYRDQQQLLSLAMDSASLGVWHWDLSEEVVRCNERMMALIGHPEREPVMTLDFWNELVHPEDLQGLRWAIQTNLKDSARPLHWEVRLRHKSSRWIWCMFSGTVVSRNAEGQAQRIAGILYDINVHKDLEEQLRIQARTDTLTQLPNRVEIQNRIHRILELARLQPNLKFAVLFMDFDRFKQVNDTLGHNVGDELLRQIAARLKSYVRSRDEMFDKRLQMAARLGGDEFVVVLNNLHRDDEAELVAQRILDELSQPYEIGPHRLRSTASIGIVTTEHMAEDADSILRDADIAMYEAKRQGRGCFVVFHPLMRRRIRDDVSLENDLRQALELKQLFVVYQPVVDLNTRHTSGLEALLRWRHPERGLVSPQSFVPVAETCGLISDIGLFVLEQACSDLRRMCLILDDRAPQFVSVNLSRAQLHHPHLVEQIKRAMRSADIAPKQLVLEVTESLAAQDNVVQSALQELRETGLSLSLDDFGVGYSSLSCLHELPVNIVKIDRSFVMEAMQSDFHRVMIEATIRMATTLHLSTVAEGIEHEDQAELMRQLGLEKGQGYLFSKPLALGDMIEWLQSRMARSFYDTKTQ